MSHEMESPDLSESVEELRAKLETMKRLIDSEDMNEEHVRSRRKMTSCRESVIDGNFLSIVFMLVLLSIIGVSAYAFFNLFVAIKKKYPGHHSEL